MSKKRWEPSCGPLLSKSIPFVINKCVFQVTYNWAIDDLLHHLTDHGGGEWRWGQVRQHKFLTTIDGILSKRHNLLVSSFWRIFQICLTLNLISGRPHRTETIDGSGQSGGEFNAELVVDCFASPLVFPFEVKFIQSSLIRGGKDVVFAALLSYNCFFISYFIFQMTNVIICCSANFWKTIDTSG